MRYTSLLLLSLMLTVGCSRPDDTTTSNTEPGDAQDMKAVEGDLGTPVEDMRAESGADMPAEDMTPAVTEDMRGPEPDMKPEVCAWPTPIIGGTPETDALVNAPARCGQPEHTWLTSGPFGQVKEYGKSYTINKALLRAFIESEGLDFADRIKYDAQMEQFSYTTQDRGALIDATAVVAYPKRADEILGTVLVLHGTTGFMDDCAPSGELEGSALAGLFATLGYIAVAPDYIGLKALGEPSPEVHPYLIGQATAIASIDSLRALPQIMADKRGDFCPDTEYVVFGGSQGGHAALWVDRLAPYYARELDLLGSVATVPPADLIAQMERALISVENSTGNTIAMLGTSAAWYEHTDKLNTAFNSPYDVDIPAALAQDCSPKDAIPEDPTIEQVFSETLYGPARMGMLEQVDPWGCIVAENGLTSTSIPRINNDSESYGILMLFGEDDDLVNTPIERDGFARLCAEQKMPMEFIECAGAGHGPASFYGMPEIMDFVAARFNREPFAAPCVVTPPTICRGTPPE